MRQILPNPILARLLARYDEAGGVLDYLFFAAEADQPPPMTHRAAALAAMVAIQRGHEQWAIKHSTPELPIERFFRVEFDPDKMQGDRISFATFWGNDDAASKPLPGGAWSIPSVDGYKTAFYQPPHSVRMPLQELDELFAAINGDILPSDRTNAEIYSWSTDWSNYFASGLEWWGAYFWTIRSDDPRRLVVIGASSTD